MMRKPKKIPQGFQVRLCRRMSGTEGSGGYSHNILAGIAGLKSKAIPYERGLLMHWMVAMRPKVVSKVAALADLCANQTQSLPSMSIASPQLRNTETQSNCGTMGSSGCVMGFNVDQLIFYFHSIISYGLEQLKVTDLIDAKG